METTTFFGKRAISMSYHVKSEETKIVALTAKSRDSGISVKNYYDIKFSKNCKSVSIKYKSSEYKASNSLNLKCPSSVKVNEEFTCYTNDNFAEIKFAKSALANGYDAIGESYGWEEEHNSQGKTTKKKEFKAKYTKEGKYQVTLKKRGYKSVTKTIKVYSGTKPTATKKTDSNKKKTLSLKCPTTAKVNQAFKCTTDQAGVTITVGGAKALASGYSSSFTTTSGDLTKDIKYSSTLFNGSWDIKKDKNKNEYVNARVTATKSGYKSITKWVKIYK